MKKKFIDKKNATTFVVMNRGTDGANVTEKVFQPVKPPNFPKDKVWQPQISLDDENDRRERSEEERSGEHMEEDFAPVGNFRKDDFALGEYGFPDDGYDYAQHFAPLGGGKWFAASPMGGVTAANRAAAVPATQEASLVAPPPAVPDFAAPKVVVVKNHGRLQARDNEEDQFADAEASDEEVRRLLEQSGDSEDAGELADDFIVAAMQKPGEAEKKATKKVADRVRFADADFEDDEEEDGSFHESDMEDDFEDDDDDEGAGGGHRNRLEDRGKRGVVQFEERMTGGMVDNWLDHLMEKEYDDEQMGEGPESLNHASSEQRGKVFANDLDDYFTEYLEVKKVPSVTVYHNGEDLDEDERRKTLLLAEKALGDEDEPVKMLETVVVDAQWDCESILSTYSNVANHPKIIEAPVSKNKPRKAPTEKVAFADAAETTKKEEPVEEKPVEAVNKGAARKKEETAEERRQRKHAVKAERKQAREAKKSLKMTYKAEAKTQQKHVNAVPFYAQTVIPMNQ